MSSKVGSVPAISVAISSMFCQNSPIHAVPSACSRWPPVGSGDERSKTPMLSSPRKPPSNRFFPWRSLRLTHQVKFASSLPKERFRKSMSLRPCSACSLRCRKIVAHACTGGFTSEKFHSYAGICPLGCRYISLSISSSCRLAKSMSRSEKATAWNARSHAAYHGYSHLSGIEITSALSMCPHCAFLTVEVVDEENGCSPCSDSHLRASR